MAFKSDNQRKGFFANLRNKYHNRMEQQHISLKNKLLNRTKEENVKLTNQIEEGIKSDELSNIKQKLKDIKTARKEIKAAKFKASPTGKFIEKAKKGASHVIAYEKKHGKAQTKKLEKFLNKLSK